PNPSQHVFSLVLENATNEKVQITVYDALGRQVKMFEKQSGNIPIHFGMDLKVGVYVVEVRQGDNRKTLKLVKQ
ncbi:MAG TPA: T9SS type A sorting domain-containing protein, partial [Chitinophagaceae bacterium]